MIDEGTNTQRNNYIYVHIYDSITHKFLAVLGAQKLGFRGSAVDQNESRNKVRALWRLPHEFALCNLQFRFALRVSVTVRVR